MAGEHDCAVEGCKAKAKAEQLMCLSHWKGLPLELQRTVNATWRRFRFEPQPYHEARAAAVAWWVGRQPGGYGRQGSLL